MERPKKTPVSAPKGKEEAKVKARKPYPTVEERITLAEAKIAKLEKLNAQRETLVNTTAALLASREEALAKSRAELEKVIRRRERLVSSKDAPAKAPRARRQSVADPQYEALKELLKTSGKSMEDLLAELKQA